MTLVEPDLNVKLKLNQFDPDFINGQLDALICYLEACQVGEYSIKDRNNWKISFKRKSSHSLGDLPIIERDGQGSVKLPA